MLSLMDIASARIRAEPNGSRVREGFAEKKEFKVGCKLLLVEVSEREAGSKNLEGKVFSQILGTNF